MNKQKKSSGHTIGNRTVIGIICIVVALAVCFGVAPLVNKLSDGKTEIVRIIRDVPAGKQISEEDIEMVEVGNYNLPSAVVTDKNEVVGKYALYQMNCGEYVLPSKLTEDINNATTILGSLENDQKAMSVTIGSFALGFSGKLETGDIVGVLVIDEEERKAFTPKELTYVKVITTTTSEGIDKSDVEDTSQPVTVTLLVSSKQAELLAYYEQESEMHLVLEYRGDPLTAQSYLDMQNEILEGSE